MEHRRKAPAQRQTPRTTPRPSPPPLIIAESAVFLDIDGTLLELAATPGGVRVDDDVAALLPALAKGLNGALAFITGRTLADADRLFPGLKLPAAGQHGFVRRAADGIVHLHPAPPELSLLREELEDLAERHAGLLFEDK